MKEDLEKTRYMPRIQDTQPLPRIDDGEIIHQPIPQVREDSKVKELPPDLKLRRQKTKSKKFTAKKKRAIILGIGFLLALFLGFALAGYSENQLAEKNNARIMQEQELAAKEKDIAAKEDDLKARRAELEKQKQELEEQEKKLAAAKNIVEGKNAALDEDKPSTAIGKIVDKVTGKAADREKAAKENTAASQKASDDLANIKQSINDAQNMLNDIDEGLAKVSAMKNEAANVRGKLAATYEENKGLVDSLVGYTKNGMDMLKNILSN